MDFLESPRFPGCPSFGYRSAPKYSVSVVRTAGGKEYRNANWSRPLLEIVCTVGPRMQDEIEELLEFWHAVGGMAYGFRFKDYADFRSCRLGATPAATDQPLVLAESGSSEDLYQLTKRYTAGVRSQDRDIFKPVPGTVRVANTLGVEQPSSRWTLDTTTGLLSPGGTFVGTPGFWGGEFDVPVRFDSEFDQEIANKAIESVSVVLRELRL